jgi:hypothetical protein
MKKMVSIVLIVFMAFQSMVQLASIAYYELNINEIEALYCINKDQPDLCCKGKCYISKKLDEQSQQNNNASNNTVRIPDFVVTSCTSISVFLNSNVFKPSNNKSVILTGYLKVFEKPPIA